MTLKLVHPSTIMVSGPTGSGKTQFVSRLIKHHMLEPEPNRIVWLYSEWQPLYDSLSLSHSSQQIEFIRGFRDEDEFYESLDPRIRNLLILDDQMSKLGGTKILSRLFTEGSHHRNLSVIYIVQNMFDKGKSHRTASLNAQYFAVFKNPRDKTQIQVLARQMFPNNSRFLVAAFQDATREPYGYLLIDLRPETPEDFRVRTKIFEGEANTVYIPN